MSFGRKLLLVLALTVFLSVGAVTGSFPLVTRRAFERANEAQSAALIAQFRREFERRAKKYASRRDDRQQRDCNPDGFGGEPRHH